MELIWQHLLDWLQSLGFTWGDHAGVALPRGVVQAAGLVVGSVWLATTHPLLFGVVLTGAVLLMWVVTVMLFRFLRAVFQRVSVAFSGSQKAV